MNSCKDIFLCYECNVYESVRHEHKILKLNYFSVYITLVDGHQERVSPYKSFVRESLAEQVGGIYGNLESTRHELL